MIQTNVVFMRPFSACLSSVLSVVTLLLLPHAQGNIWLFEDSVIITGKLPGTSERAGVTQSELTGERFDAELM